MARFADYGEALGAVRPDVVSVNIWPDTHADFAVQAFEAGAHVFLEKPIAETVADAERGVAAAKANDRRLLVGLGPRHSPTYARLMEFARELGKPLVMRMNLNRRSIGPAWTWHKNLMRSLSPIVDCGVHYADMMCHMTGAKPVRVHAIGARLASEIARDMYNYGQLQVVFDDGSVGWYEAAWGPQVSEVAFFIKDVFGPQGGVHIVVDDPKDMLVAGMTTAVSSDIHTPKSAPSRVHHARLRPDQSLAESDEEITIEDRPDHDELSVPQTAFPARRYSRQTDLADHMRDAVNSLRIVLAAGESFRAGRALEM
ncbi:MAG TPA: Gfo/Idh/MocA family oxidoreductase [Roseiarcus sp.]|nr:Gfo/Idh/MocA family oxidoreductase [Roseiarcus sp.]